MKTFTVRVQFGFVLKRISKKSLIDLQYPVNHIFSVICCAMASFIPLVTRRFHADKVVAVSLIVCYIIALILSLLTGLELMWPPNRD